MNNNNLNNNVNLTPEGTQTPVTIPNPVPQQPVNPTPMPNTGLETPQKTPMNNEEVNSQQQVMNSPMPNQPISPTQISNPIKQPTMEVPTQEPQPMTNNIPNQNTVPPTPQQPVAPQKQKSNPVLIVLMFIAIIGGAAYFGYNKFFANSSSNIGNQNTGTTVTDNNETLTEENAIIKGKELYDKATEIHEVWQLIPYCNATFDVATSKSINIGQGKYYDSGFKNIEELKNSLSEWLSNDIIDKNIKDDALSDLSLLDNEGYEYTNYIIKDDKLYCRVNTGKGWLSSYIGKYDISVNTNESNKIVFDVVSSYAKSDASTTCLNLAGGIKRGTGNCEENEIETKKTSFTIENSDNKWIVTDFTLHE